MNPNTEVLIRLTDSFTGSLSEHDELIRDVCRNVDEEDKKRLEQYVPAIQSRRQSMIEAREKMKRGEADEKELEPYLDKPDKRAPMEVLRLVICLPLALILLIAGLCCIYVPDPVWLESNEGLVYFGIVAIVAGALLLLVAVLAFVSYCKIRKYNNTLDIRNLSKREAAIADCDGQYAFEIMLADMLLRAVG